MRRTETSDAPRQFKAKVAKDGGFVIPPAFRNALGIKADDEIVMGLKDGELYIAKRPSGERQKHSVRRRARL